MGIEIERKFLVLNDNFKSEYFNKSTIIQGYICSETGKTVRVRLKNEKGFLTIKGPSGNSGLSRFEWEIPVSRQDATELLQICGNDKIEKIRYEVKSGIHIVEVDEFLGDNTGLIIAEIELNSEDEKYVKPSWLGQEVTGDKKYYNSKLIKHPFSKW